MYEEWISPAAAAQILNLSTTTVRRTVADAASADRYWGRGNWDVKPLVEKRWVLLRRTRCLEILAQRGL